MGRMAASCCVLGVLMLLATTASAISAEECQLKADVVFVLDSSRSIWPPHFDVSLQFVANVTSHFHVSPEGTHVAAVTFSKGAQVEFLLNEMTDDSPELQQRILGIEFKSGPRTETYKGLGLARDVVLSPENGARPDVPHIIIIVTDGDSSNRALTKREADIVRKMGIQVFVIGIGHYLDPEQLGEIATENTKTYVHSVSSFDTLETAMPNLIPAACKAATTTAAPVKKTTPAPKPTTTTIATTTPETLITNETKKVCSSKKADVVFVLDKSNSIKTKHFRTQLNFVNDMMGVFNIAQDHTHVGVVTFDFDPKVEFYLNKFYSKSKIRQAVVDIKYTAGSTNTFLALETVAEEVLTKEHGARDDVARVVIVVTDGKSSSVQKTKNAAEKLKKSGAYVFAIGVGNDTDRRELELIGSTPAEDYVFSVDDYSALNTIKDILAFRACEVPSGDLFVRCKQTTKPADVMFITDFSQAGGYEVKTTTNIIKEVAGGLMTVDGVVRVGHVSGDCLTVPDVNMAHSNTAKDFATALDKRGKSSSFAEILKRGRHQMTSIRRGARRGVKRVAVVFVHGPIDNLKLATREIMRAKYKGHRPGVKFVFVGVGERFVEKQLLTLGAERNPKDVSLLMSRGSKGIQWPDVLTKVCEALEKP